MKNKLFKCILRNTSQNMINMPSEIWKDIMNWELNDELVFCVEEVHHKDKVISQGVRIERKKDEILLPKDNAHLICARYIYDD